MDNTEQRFKTIEKSLTTLPLIQQSLAGLSQMMETIQLVKHTGETSNSTPLLEEISAETVHTAGENS